MPPAVMTTRAKPPAVNADGGPRLSILLMCTTFGVGGITRHALELGAWLRAQGHAVAYAGTGGPWLNTDLDPAFLELPTQDASGLGGNLASRLANVGAGARKLRAWLKRNPVDLIHAHESAPAMFARLASLGMNIPIAVTYHGSEPERVRQFGQIARRSADLVISVSRRCGDELETIGGVPAGQLQVIGLGVKPQPKVDAARVAEARRALLGPTGLFLAVTVARVTEQKGIDILVEVARRVTAQRPDIHFALVGDGPQTDEARAWAAEAGVSANLHFVGRSEEPELYLQAADLFLLTSRWEALPFTIAEAFQAGLPAVATDCGGVAELIDAEVGRVVPIGDAEAIAAAVLEIAGDEALRRSMAAAAAARSLEDRFSPAHVHRRLEQTYRSLLTPRPLRGRGRGPPA